VDLTVVVGDDTFFEVVVDFLEVDFTEEGEFLEEVRSEVIFFEDEDFGRKVVDFTEVSKFFEEVRSVVIFFDVVV
jgi:hypothetical protein